MKKHPAYVVHKGVSLYHYMKDARDLTFWYSLRPGRDESDPPGSEDMDFDVRALAAELKMPLSNDNHKEVLCAAIDSGLIKPRRVFQL